MELKSKNTDTIENEEIKDKTIRKFKPIKYDNRDKKESIKLRKVLNLFDNIKWN